MNPMFDPSNAPKPLFKWVGGKRDLLPQLLPLFPQEFDRLVEPFAGSAAVSMALRDGVKFWLNDLNKDVWRFWFCLESGLGGQLLETLKEWESLYNSEPTKETYLAARGLSPSDPFERIARFLVLNKAGFNGLYRVNSAGEFNVPWGKRQKISIVPSAEQWEILQNVMRNAHNPTSRDAIEVINQTHVGDFVYVDPPYWGTFSSYTTEGFGWQDQVRLAEACNEAVNRGVKVAVSNSNHSDVLSAYEGWAAHEIQRSGRVSSKGTGRGAVTEMLFTKGY